MSNLIAGRRVVPELLQDRFTAKNLAAVLLPLLIDGPERQQMISDLAEVGQILHPASEFTSIQRVCDAVEALLTGNAAAGGRNATANV